MFEAVGGSYNPPNKNVTFESFVEENLNKSSIEELLERVEKRARGKENFHFVILITNVS